MTTTDLPQRQEQQLREHLEAVQASKRASKEEATKAVEAATIEALRVVAEHGGAWLAKIAADRADATPAQQAELRARRVAGGGR